MILKIHTPSYPLRTFVKALIYYQGYNAPNAYEKLLPDGNAQLIIELDGNPRVLKKKSPSAEAALKRSWITGVQTKPIIYQAEQNATALCVQLEPEGLYALTGIPASEFKDQLLNATAVIGPSIYQLREQLLDYVGSDQLLSITLDYLKKQILDHASDQYLLAFIKDRFCHKNLRLSEVSQAAGYSQKHLIHVFKKHMGISPKTHQRLYRFNQVLTQLQTSPTTCLADVVFNCQYYDQAHFNNEFKTFSGYSPKQYLAFQKDYPHVIGLETAR